MTPNRRTPTAAAVLRGLDRRYEVWYRCLPWALTVAVVLLLRAALVQAGGAGLSAETAGAEVGDKPAAVETEIWLRWITRGPVNSVLQFQPPSRLVELSYRPSRRVTDGKVVEATAEQAAALRELAEKVWESEPGRAGYPIAKREFIGVVCFKGALRKGWDWEIVSSADLPELLETLISKARKIVAEGRPVFEPKGWLLADDLEGRVMGVPRGDTLEKSGVKFVEITPDLGAVAEATSRPGRWVPVSPDDHAAVAEWMGEKSSKYVKSVGRRLRVFLYAVMLVEGGEAGGL